MITRYLNIHSSNHLLKVNKFREQGFVSKLSTGFPEFWQVFHLLAIKLGEALEPNRCGFWPRLESGEDSKSQNYKCGRHRPLLDEKVVRRLFCGTISPSIGRKKLHPRKQALERVSAHYLSTSLRTLSCHWQAHMVFNKYHLMGLQRRNLSYSTNSEGASWGLLNLNLCQKSHQLLFFPKIVKQI